MRSILFILLAAISNLTFAQVKDFGYSNRNTASNYDLTYINKKPFVDLRAHKAGTKAVAMMALIPVDMPKILNAGDTTSNELDNRLTEYLFPNYRVYKTNNITHTYGVVFAQITQRYSGDVDTSSGTGLASLKEVGRKRIVALRFARNRNFSAYRLKRFDISPFWGFSTSLGYSPIQRTKNSEWSNGDYLNSTVKSNYITFGGDMYLGANVMFERFSLGLELIMLGADFQRGAGVEKVTLEQKFGNTEINREYFTSNNWETDKEFTKLKVSDNQISMYKGIRLTFCYYFDNDNQ
jgi:hypothetical protein